jgi:carbon monoxide dehydrogenase subunit G
MQITGSFVVPAPRQRVWEALNDPEILRQSIPGCEELNRVGDNEFEGKIVAKVGPVKATFTGKVTLSDLDPPNGYTISGEGKGGVAGFAKGGAKVVLADDAGGTKLDYTADASVGGKLAQIGGRLIEAAANQTASEFFTKFSEVVGAGSAGVGVPSDVTPAEPIAADATAAMGASVGKAAAAASPSRLWIWVVAGAVVVAAVVLAIAL